MTLLGPKVEVSVIPTEAEGSLFHKSFIRFVKFLKL